MSGAGVVERHTGVRGRTHAADISSRRAVMSQFIYLYRTSDAAQQESMGTPERAQQNMQRWMAWLKELDAKGHLKNYGQPLERTGRVIRGKNKLDHRRAVRRSEGPHRRFQHRRGPRHRPGRRAVARLPRARRRGSCRGAARDVDGSLDCRGAQRASLPSRVGPARRGAGADLRRPQPGAGRRRRAGRLLPRAGRVEDPRRARQPVRLADDRREAPRARRRAPRADGADVRSRAHALARVGMDARRPRWTSRSPPR